MAEVRIGMVHADRMQGHLITPDPRKLAAISFYLVYDHLVPKYGLLPAEARDIIGIKEIGTHLPGFILWR